MCAPKIQVSNLSEKTSFRYVALLQKQQSGLVSIGRKIGRIVSETVKPVGASVFPRPEHPHAIFDHYIIAAVQMQGFSFCLESPVK